MLTSRIGSDGRYTVPLARKLSRSLIIYSLTYLSFPYQDKSLQLDLVCIARSERHRVLLSHVSVSQSVMNKVFFQSNIIKKDTEPACSIEEGPFRKENPSFFSRLWEIAILSCTACTASRTWRTESTRSCFSSWMVGVTASAGRNKSFSVCNGYLDASSNRSLG